MKMIKPVLILIILLSLTSGTYLAKVDKESYGKIQSRKAKECEHTKYGSQDKEAKKIIKILKKLEKAVENNDVEVIEKYMHDDVTTFNEHTKTLLSGKDAVMKRFNEVMKEHSNDSKQPLLTYSIENPYINVQGDRATATYTASAVFGGKNKKTLSTRVTEVFQKDKGIWKRLHNRSHWNLDLLKEDKDDSKLAFTQAAAAPAVSPKDYKNLKGGNEQLGKVLNDIGALDQGVDRARHSLLELKKEISRKNLVFELDKSTKENSDPYLKPRQKWLLLYTEESLAILDLLNDGITDFESGSLTTLKEENLKKKASNHLMRLKTKLRDTALHKLELINTTHKNRYNRRSLNLAINNLLVDLDAISQAQSSLRNLFRK